MNIDEWRLRRVLLIDAARKTACKAKYLTMFKPALRLIHSIHNEQLATFIPNAEPAFRQECYARYCEYCLQGAPVRLAWKLAFRDARTRRSRS